MRKRCVLLDPCRPSLVEKQSLATRRTGLLVENDDGNAPTSSSSIFFPFLPVHWLALPLALPLARIGDSSVTPVYGVRLQSAVSLVLYELRGPLLLPDGARLELGFTLLASLDFVANQRFLATLHSLYNLSDSPTSNPSSSLVFPPTSSPSSINLANRP